MVQSLSVINRRSPMRGPEMKSISSGVASSEMALGRALPHVLGLRLPKPLGFTSRQCCSKELDQFFCTAPLVRTLLVSISMTFSVMSSSLSASCSVIILGTRVGASKFKRPWRKPEPQMECATWRAWSRWCAWRLWQLQPPPQKRTTSSALPMRIQSPQFTGWPTFVIFLKVPHLDPVSMTWNFSFSSSNWMLKCDLDAMGSVMSIWG
mmetsp:Transcript_38703/g.83360  ORF Transcript_38703/g.83360 Transcript_38703/m.83360 type:complete len:208 (+) Transcript_38703:442-1065(+)